MDGLPRAVFKAVNKFTLCVGPDGSPLSDIHGLIGEGQAGAYASASCWERARARQSVINCRAQHGGVIWRLLTQPQYFVPAVEEQFVLLDRAANVAAALVLQKVRKGYAAGIIEPVIGRPVVRAVVPEALTVELVASLWRNHADLRGTTALIHVSVLVDDGEFLGLAVEGEVGAEIEIVLTNKIVLNIDAVESQVGI